MSSEEFTYWKIIERREGFDEWRQDIRMGLFATTIANLLLSRWSKGNHTPYKPSDFVLNFWNEQKPKTQSMEEMKMIFKALAEAHKEEKPVTKRQEVYIVTKNLKVTKAGNNVRRRCRKTGS